MNYLIESERTEKKFPNGLGIRVREHDALARLIQQLIPLEKEINSIKKEIIYSEEIFESSKIQLSKFESEMLHCILGIISESLELSIQLNNNFCEGREYDKKNLCEEFGDLEWYLAMGYRLLNKTQGEIQNGNIKKLKKRFPIKFTNEKALNRDLEGESKILNENFGD